MLISSKELSSQEELLRALKKEGIKITQGTLSRDLKQLKVAKAASMNGNYIYVLPNETMYRRVASPRTAREMLQTSGFLAINFSGNMGVINGKIEDILGTIAGDDTIFIVVKEGCDRDNVLRSLNETLARM